MKGITHIEHFIENPAALMDQLNLSVIWDERMGSRKTASYGKAYNYSQINYPFQPFLPVLEQLVERLIPAIGFEPNNCLINFYADGNSKMGYHSDQTDILVANTGVAIVSLGETRTLKFRNILDQQEKVNYELNAGSLIYMTQEIQQLWQHSIPRSDTTNSRMSITFRQML